MSEMKGSGIEWIGEIPKDWALIRCKYLCKIQPGYPFNSNRFNTDRGFPLIRIRDITSGVIETYYNGDYPPEYIVKRGDCLIGMDGDFNIRWWEGEDALLNQRCCRLITADEITRRFLFYVMPSCLRVINDLAYSTTVKHLSNGDIGNSYIPIPDDIIKKEIIDLLDSKCSIIQSSIRKIEKQIHLLEEYKKSIVSEAVTKGLDSTVSMKDSGIGWIGHIPKNWKINRISSLYRDIHDPGADDLPYLTVSINNGISNRELGDDEQDRIFVRTADSSKNKRVRPNDLAYNMMRAWQGAFGAAEVDGMVSSAYVVARPVTQVSSKYVEHLLRTPSAMEEIRRRSHGIADFRLRLYWSQFKEIQVALPEYSEQLRVVDVLGRMTSNIESTIYKKKEIIERMNDYMRSLIYEYVTGKRQVGTES